MSTGNELIIIAELTAVPGKETELRHALVSMLAPSRAEPGCELYQLHEDPASPGRFFFYEIWKDQAAFDFHTQTKHFKALGPALVPLKADNVPLRKLKVVQSTSTARG